MTRAMASAVVCITTLGTILPSIHSEDKKKHIVVRAGEGFHQVNNHPWSYTTPGKANTNCSTSGTVNASGTTVGNTTDVYGNVNANTDCSTTYHPPQTTTGNRVTVDNASWVTDLGSGDQYLIRCTAGWAGSKCSYLTGGEYKAALEGNTMWITGMKGMKEMTSKYHILQYVRGDKAAAASLVPSTVVSASSSNWTGEEKFTWSWYSDLPEEDRSYVREFCPANPSDRALLPRAKVNAGQPADRALYCAAWLSAKAKL